MAAAFAREGGYGAPTSVIHVDSSHPDHIVVPDAQLLFTADFRRAGPDLVLTGHDGRHHIIPGYFSSEQRPALAAPNGASLPPDVIDLLAGSPAPNEYAQAGTVPAPDPIGKVEKVIGSVAVMRNGVAVTLNVGDNVYKSDVIQTGADSQVGISFPDGTALNLTANTRMALNDYTFDPSATSGNGALISLVEGSFSFVAGKVAHTGDMKIDTPVATMGIRGTTGWVAEVTATVGNQTYTFAVVPDYGTNQSGMYDLIDRAGNVIATVSQPGFVTSVSPQGTGVAPLVTVTPATTQQVQFEQEVIQQVFQTLTTGQQQQQQQNQQTNPQSNPSSPGSTTPPSDMPGNNGQGPAPAPINTGPPPVIPINVTPTPTPTPSPTPTPTPQPTPTSTPATTVTASSWVGGTAGNLNVAPGWSIAPNWSNGVPGPNTAVTITPASPATVIVDDSEQAASLTVAANNNLEVVNNANGIDSGSLSVSGAVDDAGLIQVNSTVSDPSITFSGPVTVESTGEIEAHGTPGSPTPLASVNFLGDTVINDGTITADNDGAITFLFASALNESGATISATSAGTLTFEASALTNQGTIAANGGDITIDNTQLQNSSLMLAENGGVLTLSNGGLGTNVFENTGTIEAGFGGTVDIDNSALDNAGGTIEALSGTVDIASSTIDNVGGTITTSGGIVYLSDSIVEGGTVAADVDVTASSTLDDGAVVTGSTLSLASGTILSLDDVTLANTTIDLGTGDTIEIDAGQTLTLTGADSLSGGAVIIDNDGSILRDGTLSIGVPMETYEGSGTVTLQGGNNPTGTLTLVNDGNTFEGYQQFGTDTDQQTVINDANGTFDADVSGKAFTFDTGNTITNAGMFEATNGATLEIENSTVANTGTIQAAAGSEVELSHATINGGTIDLADGTASVQSITEISVPGFDSFQPLVSGNGQFIVFQAASSLAGVTSGDHVIELYHAGQVTEISALAPANGGQFNSPSISDNGTYVVFEGDYPVPGQNYTSGDIFVYDTQTQAITQVQSNAYDPFISGNGQFIAMEENSALGNGNSVVVTDLSGDVLTTINGDPNYPPVQNGPFPYGSAGSVQDPSISSTGQFVSFWSTSSELVINGTTFFTGNSAGTAQVYVYDRTNNALQMVSVNDQGQEGNNDSGAVTLANDQSSSQSELSANGVYVVFESSATNLVAGSGSGAEQNGVSSPVFGGGASNVYLYDTQTHTIQLVSGGLGGAAANGASYYPTISADGDYVTFESTASNLVAGGSGGEAQTYVYDTQTGTIELVSATANGTPADNESDLAATVSDDGSVFAYGSLADNLVTPTANGGDANIFVTDLSQGPGGVLDVTANATISGGATIDGGEITVASGVTLTLNDVTISGSTIEDATGYTFTNPSNPTLTGAAPFQDNVSAINAAGEVVGYFDDNNSNNSTGYIYSNGVFTLLNDPSAAASGTNDGFAGTVARDINSSGEVVGYYTTSTSAIYGFLYNGDFTTLSDPLAPQSTQAVGINDSDVIVGNVYVSTNDSEGFVDIAGNYTNLQGPLGASNFGTSVVAINDFNQVIGDYYDAEGQSHGFIYNIGNGGYTTLNDRLAASGAGFGTDVEAISNKGLVVGYYVDASGKDNGFIYSNGSFTTIDDPAGVDGTVAEGVNDIGQVVGYYLDANGDYHAFVYSGGVYSDLVDSAAVGGSAAFAINDLGQIAGLYVDANGGVRTFTAAAINNGTLAFTGSSTLDNVEIDGGAITVASGVTLTLDNVVLDNVALTISSDGTTPSIQIDAGDTVTWEGASAFGGPGGSGTDIIDNNGHIIHAGALLLGFSTTIFEGSGTITENGGNYGVVSTIEVNEGNTFDGYGQQGSGVAGSFTLTNGAAGVFDADVAGQPFILDSGASTITNLGLFEATNGATLIIESTVAGDTTVVDNTDGQVEVAAGSEVELANATIDGGTVSIAATGLLLGISPGTGGDGAAEIENAIINNSGTFETGGTFTLDNDTINGGTVDDNGNITVAGSSLFDNGVDVTGGGTLTVNSGQTLSADDATLTGTAVTNHGNIDIDAGSTLQIVSGTVANTGTIELNGSSASVEFGTVETLTSFSNINNNGSVEAGVIADAAGDLFGTTWPGGTNNDGTVFEIAHTGGGYASVPITLVNFSYDIGFEPVAGLIADAAGDLFGTTQYGVADGAGTVFELVNSGGGSYTFTTLVSFNGNNGFAPSGALIADAAGDLFGTTQAGGIGDGTVFEIAKTGGNYASTPTTLANFDGSNGQAPFGALIADAAGDLFGTTDSGGTSGLGTVFELVNNGGGSYTLTTLVSFSGPNGESPVGGLIMDAAGDLFSTTSGGGMNGDGTVFEIAKTGGSYATTPTTLVSFDYTNGDRPVAGLVADATGDLFGTTSSGGADGYGTIFELVNNGGDYTLTTLAGFNGSNGANPYAGLIADAAGDLFGTTVDGGANGDGTVFELPSVATPPTQLEISGTLTLDGGSGGATGPGQVLLSDSSANFIVSDGSAATLTNVDNTISGAGTIGDAYLTLDNEQYGVIDANDSTPLILATGSNTITNTGTLEASNGGELSVQSAVDNAVGNTNGTIDAAGGFIDFWLNVSGGTATISDGGTLEYGWSSNVATTFDGAGTLVLDNQFQVDPTFSAAFYSGTIGNFALDDVLVLSGYQSPSTGFHSQAGDLFTTSASYDSDNNTTQLTITDTTQNNASASVTLAGDYSTATLASENLGWSVTANNSGGVDVTEAPLVQGPVANNVTITNATGPTSGGWSLDPQNGHYYKFVAATDSFDSAVSDAQADNGAYLATVTSAAEDNFIAQLVASSGGSTPWIGGETTQDPPDGQASDTAPFYWVAGPEANALFTFTDWSNNGNPPGNTEPNGGFYESTQAVQIFSNGEWNDVPVNFNSGYSYVEEWGGQAGQVAFTENTPTTLATSVLLADDTDAYSSGGPLTVTAVGAAAHGTVSLDGNVITYDPSLDYSGADSFTYTISDGTYSSTGTVSFDVAAAPTVEWIGGTGSWDSTNWTPNAATSDTTPTGADDATINATDASYTVTIGGTDTAQTLTVNSAAATVVDSGSLSLTGGLEVDSGSFELQGGSLSALSIDVANGASFSGYGTVTGPVAVSGTIEATDQPGSALEFTGVVTGSGAFTIDAGASLQFDSATSTGSTVSFAGSTGTLILGAPDYFQGTISDLSGSDVLDLREFFDSNGNPVSAQPGDTFETSTSAGYVTGTTLLTVTDEANGNSAFVTLVGDYSSTSWSISYDGNGGADVAKTPAGPTTDTWTGSAGDGEWSTAGNWDNGVPGADSEVNIVSGGIVMFDSSASPDTIDSLSTDGSTTLDIAAASSLTVTSDTAVLLGPVENAGTLDITNGTLNLVTNSGSVNVAGDNTVLMIGDTDNASGTIAAYDGGDEFGSTIQLDNITITSGTLIIGDSTTGDTNDVLSVDNGDSATLDGVAVQNSGTIDVGVASGAMLMLDDDTTISGGTLTVGSSGEVEITSGTVTFNGVSVTDGNSIQIDSGATLAVQDMTGITVDGALTNTGTLEANGAGSTVSVEGSGSNFGLIEAVGGGAVSFNGAFTDSASVGNASGATIEATGVGSTVSIGVSGHLTDVNNGLIEAVDGGTVSFVGNAGGINNSDGTIEAAGAGSTVSIAAARSNHGLIEAADGGTVSFGAIGDNQNYGTIEATGAGSTVSAFGGDDVSTNSGIIVAADGGAVSISGNFENDGALEADGGTVVVSSTAIVTGSGTVEIGDGGAAEFAGNFDLNVSFVGAGTLVLGQSESYAATVSGFGTEDVLDLTDLGYAASDRVVWTQDGSGGSLAIDNSDGTQVDSIQLAGTYSSADFALTKDSGNGTAVTFVEPDFVAQVQYPAIVQGEHLFGVNPQFDSLADLVALAYVDTFNYSTGETSYQATQNLELLDPFFLPSANAPETVESFTLQAPGRYNLIVPNIEFGSPSDVQAEGILVYKGQATDGNNAIYQIIGTSSGDGSVTFGSPTEITETDDTIYNLKEVFRQTDSIASSYAVAWDQFDSSSGSYTLEIQLTNINSAGSFTSTAILPITVAASGLADTDLPAWDFKPAGGAYVLADAVTNTAANSGLNLYETHDAIQFTGYTLNGSDTAVVTDSTSFTLQPDLAAYTADSNVSNEIVQPIIASLSAYPGQVAQALQFAQSPDNGNDYFVVWNETITSSGNSIGDQVEFAAVQSGAVVTGSRAEFQIADGQAQNVRITEFTDPNNTAQDDVVVVYGDDTGTHINEYAVTASGTVVTLLDSITDPTTQAFDNLTVLGNGLIAITYNDLIDSSTGETSQYDFKLFDLAQQGLDVTPANLSSTENNYIAGTQYDDTVTGVSVSDISNLYYFVGLATTSGVGPTDSFTGGASGDGWNIAVFADARSDYTITTETGSGPPYITTIASNGDDPEHTGSLAVSNVQILAFDPVNDPTPQNNTIDVTGGTYVILGDYNTGSVTIEAGATAELDIAATGATSYTGNVAFEAATGTLVVDQLNEFQGTVSFASGTPSSGDVLDLGGFNAHMGDVFETSASLNGANTILTVTDTTVGNSDSESITLAGNDTGDIWSATYDGNGGANVVDPPATESAISVLSSATADGATGNVTFADANSADTFTTSFTPEGSNYIGTFSADQPNESGGDASVGFQFELANDQINLAPGQTLTQSYNVILADAQNPAASQSQTVSVSIGGPGNDNFTFAPGVGADTITNFNPQADTIELDHFANVQTVQELQALITTDAHGDAVINLGHNDSITVAGVTVPQLQQVIQAGHVLLH